MIKMIIVDDESTTCNGLLRHINWKALGIDMIQTAQSGPEALSLCQDFVPDLVLSDIRMRGMTGIEMCTQIKEMYPNCQIIFVSGYSDKAYLKAAITLGAVNYVEKPVQREELEAAVAKAIREIESRRRQENISSGYNQSISHARRSVLLSLVEQTIGENQEQGAQLSGLFDWGSCSVRLCILRTSQPVMNIRRFMDQFFLAFGGETEIPGDLGWFACYRDNREFLVLLWGEKEAISDSSPYLSALCRFITNFSIGGDIQLFLAVGAIVPAADRLPHSYQTARQALQRLLFQGYRSFSFGNGPDEQPPPLEFDANIYREFSTCLSRREEQAALALLEALYRRISPQRQASGTLVRSIYYDLDYRVFCEERERRRGAGREHPEDVKYDWHKFDDTDTLLEIHRHVCGRVSGFIATERQDAVNSSAVGQVIRTITENYGDKDISVKLLAQEVYLTPTYLSALFKRKVGKTIGQYITAVRIEKAKELLGDNRYKLYHIADLVGYENPNYFAKIFKKQEGVTPKEYRERQG